MPAAMTTRACNPNPRRSSIPKRSLTSNGGIGSDTLSIRDILTVHDCFYCLAPQATRLHKIILDQLDKMYRDNDPLAALHVRNVRDPDIQVPPKGTAVTFQDGTQLGRRLFSLDHV